MRTSTNAARRVLACAMGAALAVGAACRDASTAMPAGAEPTTHPPGYVVDSAIPNAEAQRRFRVGLPVVTTLDTAAAPSRDQLVQAFARAVAARDTARLRRLAITRAEFAYLYYPFTPYTHPPTELAPETLWFLSQSASDKGMRRVADRLGGDGFRIVEYTCDPEPAVQEANRFWQNCQVRYVAAGDSATTRRLFGSVMERGGRFKFVTYSNDF